MASGSEILERAVADFGPVVRALGFEPKRGDRAACALCGSTNPSSFSFKPEAGKWHCFRCHRGGGVLDLVQEITGCDRRGAMAWLADFYRVPLDSSPFTAQQRREWHGRQQRRSG